MSKATTTDKTKTRKTKKLIMNRSRYRIISRVCSVTTPLDSKEKRRKTVRVILISAEVQLI